MAEFKYKFNIRTGLWDLVPTNIVLAFKAGVAAYANLPLTGNTKGDSRIANDTGHLYVWSIDASSGLITDWVDAGDIVDLNWSAISGKPSSTVADIDDAVSKKHSQNTDTYLANVVTNILYVDGNRVDTYTANGSITKPFKKIQDAIDAVTAPSATNKYLIEIAPGAYYSDSLAINKVYVTFRSCGVQGARISGAITVTNPSSPTPEQITFIGLRISGGLTCLASHIAINCVDCNITGSAWTLNPSIPTDDEYLQVWGGLWNVTTNLTNIYTYLMGGGYYSTFNATNCEFNINNADINDPFQVTLNGTVIASAYGDRAGNSKFILNTGSTLYMDADTEGGSVLTMAGGTLVRTTKAVNIVNTPAGDIAATDVQAAINELDTEKGVKNILINEQTDNYTLVLTDAEKMIDMNKALAVTLTIPKNSSVAFPIGTRLTVRQKGIGKVMINPIDGDVVIDNADGFMTANQYAVATLLKIDTNTWMLYGSLKKDSFKFTVQTTTPAETFALPLLAGTHDFVVNWGDGTNYSSITAYDDADRIHTYADAGIYTITMWGTCTDFAFNGGGDKLKVKQLLEFVGDIGFTTLNFNGCSNLTTLTASMKNLKSLITASNMFNGCISITGNIPNGIFDGSIGITNFWYTFADCTGLTGAIPTDLFRYNLLANIFYYTFGGCLGLTSIPIGLFSYNVLVGQFDYVFYGCTGLTSIPPYLFRYNTLATRFDGVFYGCTGLTSIPAKLFRYNILATNMGVIFYGCTGLTSIPTDLFRYNTSVTTFHGLFQYCSGLTGAIPTDLFRYNTLATTCRYIFMGCTNLTGTIPVDLFRYNILAINFTNTFWGCVGLTGAIPTDLFRYNTLATDMDLTFYNCTGLTSIPTDLFRYNTLITTFTQVFLGCSGLTGAIPTDLFRYNTLVTSFNRVFYGCTGLTTIPADLFRYNPLVTTFGYAFCFCIGLTTIPPYLFRYNTLATQFDGTFYDCTNLQLNSDIFYLSGTGGEWDTRFLDQSVDFTNCFYRNNWFGGTGDIGTAPDLWNCDFGTGTPTKTGCYGGAGGNSILSLDNYDDIPGDWIA